MKTLIWPVSTRIFHWLLAVGFATAYILGDADEISNFHFAFGACVGVLLLFRIFYGLIGPRYSHFRDFPIGINNQKLFINSMANNKNPFAGHNPAASLIMIAIMIIGILCSISGYVLYSNINHTSLLTLSEDTLKEMHEVLANIFLGLVIIHLTGILVDTVAHPKTGTLLSMISGYKNTESEAVRTNGFQKAYTLLWLIVPLIVFYLAYKLPAIQSDENGKDKIEHADSEDDD